MLQDPLRALPGFISQAYQAQTSLERLQAFYTLSEQTDSNASCASSPRGSTDNLNTQSAVGEVALKNISFSWRASPLSIANSTNSSGISGSDVNHKTNHGLFSIESAAEDEEESGDTMTVNSDTDSLSEGVAPQGKMTALQRLAASGRRVLGLSSGTYNKLAGSDKEPSSDVNNATTSTSSSTSSVTLHIDSLHVLSGQLAVIRGSIGSGKSSLCSALLNEMYITANSGAESYGEPPLHSVIGSVSYVSQQAWIQNLTVRDNILFGSPFSHEKYVRVLDACCLVQDLQ
eukprot:gene32441-40039_t